MIVTLRDPDGMVSAASITPDHAEVVSTDSGFGAIFVEGDCHFYLFGLNESKAVEIAEVFNRPEQMGLGK